VYARWAVLRPVAQVPVAQVPAAQVPAATMALDRFLAATATPWEPGGPGVLDPATTTVRRFLSEKAALPARLPKVA
jgi:hypothetical protein